MRPVIIGLLALVGALVAPAIGLTGQESDDPVALMRSGDSELMNRGIWLAWNAIDVQERSAELDELIGGLADLARTADDPNLAGTAVDLIGRWGSWADGAVPLLVDLYGSAADIGVKGSALRGLSVNVDTLSAATALGHIARDIALEPSWSGLGENAVWHLAGLGDPGRLELSELAADTALVGTDVQWAARAELEKPPVIKR